MTNYNNGHEAKWTIIIYMAVDDAIGINEAYRFLGELQELSPLFKPRDTAEMEDTREVRVFLQAYTNWNEKKNPDGTIAKAGGFGPRRFEIDSNFTLENWLDIDIEKGKQEFKMGSADALYDFIDWCQGVGPAEKYLLFLWGHGTGSSMFSRNLDASFTEIKTAIRSILMTDMETGQPINDIKEMIKGDSPLFKNNKARIKVELKDKYYEYKSNEIIVTRRKTTDFYKRKPGFEYPPYLYDIERARNGQSVLSLTANNVRKYLSTRSSLDALLEQEIREGLKKIKEPKNKIDILLIMGCAMQMVEFAYEIRDHCRYFIGSEELIYFHGYNYFDSFAALVDYPDMDAETFAKRIVQEAPIKQTYTDFEKHSLAISCVDLKKSNSLTELLDEFATKVKALKDNEPLWLKIKKARRQCRHFGEDAYTYSFIDVAWFFKKFTELVNGYVKYKGLKETAKKIIILLEEQYIVQSWIGKKRTPTLYESRSYGGHGVGIYFPESEKAHNDNADLKIFFERGNELQNEFTKNNTWYDMIYEYRTKYGEVSSYPLTDNPAPEDAEIEGNREEIQKLHESLADQLLEIEKMRTETIADQLLEDLKNSPYKYKTNNIAVDLLLEIEKTKTGTLADLLLRDYVNSNMVLNTEE